MSVRIRDCLSLLNITNEENQVTLETYIRR